ncbi:maleylpyruvate isomerase family mycothiol-dependent enzyme [Actinoallomurus rhizosphaericola]|uniref:maleylpyruvate isomerase family mycothiol-dependent enzyme n=1 Tax=Actinoallomurus rhizosphaericola TaxID=2952536 RepID=UPI002092F117|nr:maleylpyruvate isomerase family mycothiol-dependent enzyme [Actinoallomurus rhizosphaericola]MCO5998538.1 maleylpyruvate isomerase family mycothiol-dependent enzyme [Actinoallomurus rhizosphaericola]
MRRAEVVAGLAGEYARFAALIDGLSPEEWRTATRCTGWEVRDVAGHVVGNVVDSVRGVIGSRTPDDQARAFRDAEPADLAARLREAAARLIPFLEALDDAAWERPSPQPHRSLGNGVHTLWYDAFVHGDDIRAALGRPGERGPGLLASVRWLRDELERLGRGPVRLVLDGAGEYAVGAGGPVLRGDPLRFVLVATGRADPGEFGTDASINVHLR